MYSIIDVPQGLAMRLDLTSMHTCKGDEKK